MKRQSGYYWVNQGGLWEVAFWNAVISEWHVTGSSTYWGDSIFDQINETRILAPDEVSDE